MSDTTTQAKKKPSVWSILFWVIFNPIVAILIALAIIFIPLSNTLPKATSPSIYDNVFVAELGAKYDRLCAIKEPKLVVVGGSSVAFGLDSELLGRYTGMEVVNFGLYATLGSKVMLDLSVNAMNEGDVVVFAPEPDAQTMSLYFGADAVWQAIDVSPQLYDIIAVENNQALNEAFPKYLERKASYDQKPNPDGVYNSKNFNQYGDINYPRPYNTLAMGYDPNTLFGFDKNIVSEDFIDYFNDYCQTLLDRGVKVFFSYCPINNLALEEGVTKEKIDAFEAYLDEVLLCPIISDMDDYIMNWGYFFDTNMHLNDAGVIARTNMLIEDLRGALGLNTPITLYTPDAPGREGDNEVVDGDNIFLDYFEYQEVSLPDGTVIGQKIVAVTEKARQNAEKEITIPYSVGELPVISISADVLCEIPNLEILHLGENIRSIEDGAFRGCESLCDVYLYFGPDNCSVSIPDESNPDGFLIGANEMVIFHATEEHIGNFNNHYTWGHYFDRFDFSNMT